MVHIYVTTITNAIIGSDTGLWPIRRQAITWSNSDWLSISFPGNFSLEFESKYYNFHSRKFIWTRLQIVNQYVSVSLIG